MTADMTANLTSAIFVSSTGTEFKQSVKMERPMDAKGREHNNPELKYRRWVFLVRHLFFQ